ncbi:MAG: exodeoxyribonuclease VII large subunit [Saprospirales bacterium]|nr:exodeoxyribonuclease VII large subunit [Saprospirales bacterium]
MQRFTLFELNEFIRRVVSLNFSEPVWVQCEIFQVNVSRGHFYIQLVQKDGEQDQVLARADAVLWQRQHQALRRQLGGALDEVLREGLEVLMQVRVAFDERFGLQYHIEQIDPAFSIGKLEIRRREAVRQLGEEGLLQMNGAIPLPPVIQRIAVLSSPEAAGLQDFLDQLRQNPYGYRFLASLFPTAVQGPRVEPEMLERLRAIDARRDAFDCVVLLRGGGSRLDLAAFDQLELCRSIAHCPLPFFTGIGHEIDETVADLVAHTSLKTPTAVAEYLIDHNARFESEVVQAGSRIGQTALFQIRNQQLPLLEQQLQSAIRLRLQREAQHLDLLAAQCELLDPQRALDRGYAYITRDGKGINSILQIGKDEQVRIHLKDGAADSTIQKIIPKP